jgi:hypothetical protein
MCVWGRAAAHIHYARMNRAERQRMYEWSECSKIETIRGHFFA